MIHGEITNLKKSKKLENQMVSGWNLNLADIF